MRIVSPQFSGFQPEDRDAFMQPAPPTFPQRRAKPIRQLPAPPAVPPQIQVGIQDKVLLGRLAEASETGQSGRRWALEWKLKARVVQLNRWADGQIPYPRKGRLWTLFYQWKSKRDARHLFHGIATSHTYRPSPWLLPHLNQLRLAYGLNIRPYFPQPTD